MDTHTHTDIGNSCHGNAYMHDHTLTHTHTIGPNEATGSELHVQCTLLLNKRIRSFINDKLIKNLKMNKRERERERERGTLG